MENENKCFFSISLENGIVITGESPEMLLKTLMDLYTACIDSKRVSEKEDFKFFAKKMKDYADQIWKARNTIKNQIKNMEKKQ